MLENKGIVAFGQPEDDIARFLRTTVEFAGFDLVGYAVEEDRRVVSDAVRIDQFE